MLAVGDEDLVRYEFDAVGHVLHAAGDVLPVRQRGAGASLIKTLKPVRQTDPTGRTHNPYQSFHGMRKYSSTALNRSCAARHVSVR